MSILDRIHAHQDLEALNPTQRKTLCHEIREFLVDNLSRTGGHVASNLGVVELTVALETVFDTAKDRLVFDVGHQSYIHKMLTGRQADFASLRQFGGMAGFPKPSESVTDAFVAGHASSSVSIALGMARARTLSGADYHIVTLLGDGAATGGIAYEGLNDAAVSKEPMIIVLNDNAMSIDHNVGGMAKHLAKLRTKERYLGMKRSYRKIMGRIPGGKWIYKITRGMKDRIRRLLLPTTIFESMGFRYLGPVDGHDTERLISLLNSAKAMRCPVVIHVMTQKGRGYLPAEQSPKLFHGIGRFDPVTGTPHKQGGETFSQAFGQTMVRLGRDNPKVCAITAAMPGGTGLLDFKAAYPERLFDVGIAEEHAVSMAGGLAKQGMIPVVALYSTFLQRAYDMILQDVCMQNLHVVFAVDRAGLVGEDGETHHGIFDVGFLGQAPNLTILCPGSLQELQDMLHWAVEKQSGPVAIRYPRGGNRGYGESAWNNQDQQVCCHREGGSSVLLTYGTLLQNALEAASILEESGIQAAVLRMLSVKPLPVAQLASLLPENATVFCLEEICTGSGICQKLSWELGKIRPDCKMYGIDLGHRFVPHGSIAALYQDAGLDAASIAEYVREVRQHEN